MTQTLIVHTTNVDLRVHFCSREPRVQRLTSIVIVSATKTIECVEVGMGHVKCEISEKRGLERSMTAEANAGGKHTRNQTYPAAFSCSPK